MKKIKYAVLGYTGVFNPETEEVEEKEVVSYSIIDYSAEAEEMAKKIAHNGDYEIFDDGEPEPVAKPTDAERIAELEEALALLLSGVTE